MKSSARSARGDSSTEVALEDAYLLERRGRYPESEAALRETTRLAATWDQPDLLRRAVIRQMLVVGFRQHRFDEAIQLRALAEGLAQGNPLAEARVLSNLGSLYHSAGKYALARESLQRALTIREALSVREGALGPEHPVVAHTLGDIAGLPEHRGEYEAAMNVARRALAILEGSLGPEHPVLAKAVKDVARIHALQKDFEPAAAAFERALRIEEAALGPDHPDLARTLNNLGLLRLEQGQHVQAIETLERARGIFEASVGLQHPDAIELERNLARARVAP